MTKVLVVDDSVFQRNNLRYILQSAGYEVLEARDGQKALARIVTEPPDCIILDIMMPKMSGFEFLEALCVQGISIPVIVFTADIQASTRQRCLDAGAKAVLPKPISADNLVALMAHLLDQATEDRTS